ncbi:MAG: aminoacyl-tRNA hydrolase [Candidatus Omnitrophica bacterium]|nr:aminoacyl-tRNA hydrolase [Candidatus Omnitrophota bacterium]MBU4589688.1 aminoacyl-tRNA hydrolase [Candidatus Omnitrophota bacterium]
MKLIIGLGNPGKDYKLTRHNIGFLVLERVAKENKIRFRSHRKFKAFTGEGAIDGENTYLAMPQTFMNLSGHSVRSIVNWLKIGLEDVLLVVDDVALPFGALRIREKGSDGGHKGLRSVIDSLGTGEFSRMRIGIMGRSSVRDCSKYVLGRFTKAEQKNLSEILDHASGACGCWIKKGVQTAMNRYNGG